MAGSVAEWLACWTQAQKGPSSIAVATLSGNSLRQTVHTHCASVHRAAKLVAALLRVAGGNCGPGGKYWQPTAGHKTHVTCRLNAKNRDQLRSLRSVIEYGLALPLPLSVVAFACNRSLCGLCRADTINYSLCQRSRLQTSTFSTTIASG